MPFGHGDLLLLQREVPDAQVEAAALREALRGRFEAHHALIIGAILAHLDFLDEQIGQLSEAIEAELGPTGMAGVTLADTMTGVDVRTAEVLVAEIGRASCRERVS